MTVHWFTLYTFFYKNNFIRTVRLKLDIKQEQAKNNIRLDIQNLIRTISG